jgi:hypothetical protein
MTRRKFQTLPSRFKWPDFPAWFVICCGIAVVVLSLPLAFKVGWSGSFDFACPSRSGSSHDLALRNWQSHGGWIAYLHAAAWFSIALSGIFLVFKTKYRAASVIYLGFIGSVMLCFTFWFIC